MAVEFTKEFWQKKRDSSAKGSGVGKALEIWKQKCLEPSKLATTQAFKDARTAADGLKKALVVAKQKAAKSQPTLNMIKEYEADIAKYLTKVQEIYQGNCANFIKARKDLLQMAQRKSVQFEDLVNRAKANLERVEQYEEQAPDAPEPGQQMMWKNTHQMQEEMKQLATEMAKIESSTSPTMVDLKAKNPGHYNVELADVKESEKYMMTATTRMNECSSFLKQMKQIQDDFNGAAAEVLSALSGQKKDRGQALNAGIKTRQEAAKVLQEINETVQRGIQVNLADLRKIGSKQAVTANDKEVAPIRVQDMTNRRQHIETRVGKMTAFVKEFNRFSRAFPKDPNIQESANDIATHHEQAVNALKTYDAALNQAKQLASSIATKPLAVG